MDQQKQFGSNRFGGRHFRRRGFVIFPVLALIAISVLGAVVRFLWNAILPEAVNANPISYWQAVGLLILCKILCGGFGPGGGRRGRWRNGGKFARNNTDHPGRFGAWRTKWMAMSEEERLKFRQEMRRRCGKPPENN
jgi:hypothetical protein